jgi:hypothetical protein
LRNCFSIPDLLATVRSYQGRPNKSPKCPVIKVMHSKCYVRRAALNLE